MEYYPLPKEDTIPPEDHALPSEYSLNFKYEFAQESAPEKPKETVSDHSRIRKTMLMPLVATITTAAVVFASFSYDPLGIDVLANGSAGSYVPVSIDYPEDPVGTEIYVHVTYVPTAETYTPETTGDAALNEAVAWVTGKGGDPSTMLLIDSVFTANPEYSDDAIVVGDPDDPDNLYIAQGTVTYTYRRDVYYEAYAANAVSDADDEFPQLRNMRPDFAGRYSWGGYGSELYVRFIEGDSETYLVAGDAWKAIDDATEATIPNAVYDQDTNTLTLTNFTGEVLDVNLMGNSFTIQLVGDNYLDCISIWGAYYGGSVTFTGTGSLTLNRNGAYSVGLDLRAEWSQTCLMVDKGVTLDIYGEKAILITSTTMEKAIYYLYPNRLIGGTRAAGQFTEYYAPVYDSNGYYIGREPTTLEEISQQDGQNYYDYTVVDENGEPSTHVRFAP